MSNKHIRFPHIQISKYLYYLIIKDVYMLPTSIQRSDDDNLHTTYECHIFKFILKGCILLIFPMVLLENTWLVGAYNDSIIYTGLTHTISNGIIIEYSELCTDNKQWACDLHSLSYNTKVCLIIYLFSFLLHTIFTAWAILSSRIKHIVNQTEPFISTSLNLFLYIILLVYANIIPHKFDSTLVEFESAFGVAFICCILHIVHSFISVSERYITSTQIEEISSHLIKTTMQLTLPGKLLLGTLSIQLIFTLPLFIKHLTWQNTTPIYGILWLFYQNDILYTSYISLISLTLFIDTFNISMMKQTQYETATELMVNVIFVIIFILHFTVHFTVRIIRTVSYVNVRTVSYIYRTVPYRTYVHTYIHYTYDVRTVSGTAGPGSLFPEPEY